MLVLLDVLLMLHVHRAPYSSSWHLHGGHYTECCMQMLGLQMVHLLQQQHTVACCVKM
jgi:hypothetical protein